MNFEPYIFVVYGLIIVFSGLTFLAVAVSNIHKIILITDRLKLRKIKNSENKKIPGITKEFTAKIKNFIVLTKNSDAAFYLPEIIKEALCFGILNPWETIDVMIKKKVIVPDDKCMFLWNKDSSCYKKIIKKRG